MEVISTTVDNYFNTFGRAECFFSSYLLSHQFCRVNRPEVYEFKAMFTVSTNELILTGLCITCFSLKEGQMF
jgi:hypothetical protein